MCTMSNDPGCFSLEHKGQTSGVKIISNNYLEIMVPTRPALAPPVTMQRFPTSKVMMSETAPKRLASCDGCAGGCDAAIRVSRCVRQHAPLHGVAEARTPRLYLRLRLHLRPKLEKHQRNKNEVPERPQQCAREQAR